jgi:ribonucleoside-diphosphate reductase alpha chain
MSAGFDRRGKPNVRLEPERATPATAPRLDATLTQSEARSSGYTGNVCDICHSTRMRVAGHCMVCEDCGTTTGCS